MPNTGSSSSKSKKSKPKKWGTATKPKEEHAKREIFIEEEIVATIKEEVPKMKMITPSLIAQKYNVRISIIKGILRELLEEKKIKTFIHTNKLRVYIPT
ncbi:MAG: hypothetical protein ACTSRC_17200 [Candidatus Helarchaeota archaeon]